MSSPAKIISTIKRQKLLDKLFAEVDDQATHPCNVNDLDSEVESLAEPPGVEEARSVFNQDKDQNESVLNI